MYTMLTTICRRVGDFLDHSIKPNLFRKGDTSALKSLNYDQVLPVRWLNAQIISPTTYFDT